MQFIELRKIMGEAGLGGKVRSSVWDVSTFEGAY